MSNFRLYPMPQSKFMNLRELLDTAAKEMNLTERSSWDAWLQRMNAGYAAQYMAIYVDDVETPKHVLILANWPGMVTKGTLTAVVLIYSHPEQRGDPKTAATLMHTIENYARINGSTSILGSSWTYLGNRPIDSLWKAYGYVEQEITYVKLL